MVVAYVALGSNLGNRLEWIERALERLSREPGIKIMRTSRIVETKPLGVIEQPNYLNGVTQIETLLSPVELLQRLLGVEKALGRKREKRWGPRTIDLDILYYGDQIVDHPQVRIPHPELHYRPFLLESLRELHAPIR